MKNWSVFAEGDFGLTENPIWDKTRQGLWWIDIPNCNVHFKTANGDCKTYPLHEEPGALWLEKSTVMVAATTGIYQLNDGQWHKRIDSPFDPHQQRFNDCAVHPNGSVLLGSLIKDKSTPKAQVFRWDGHQIQPLLEQRMTVNGLGFWGDKALVADTYYRRIEWFSMDNFPIKPDILWHQPQSISRPDGVAVLDDWLVFAMFEGACLLAIHALTREQRCLPVPVFCPTKITLGGEDNEWIFMTSAGTVRPAHEKQKFNFAGEILSLRTQELMKQLR